MNEVPARRWTSSQTFFITGWRGHKFTALFARNDVIASGAIKALNEAGFRIPEDIALVGTTTLRWPRLPCPH
jgi:DNA-binding LacI/PurR family transcriptional regulator